MRLTNAQHQAAHRARRAKYHQGLESLARMVLAELATSNTDKGKRLYAAAQDALGGKA